MPMTTATLVWAAFFALLARPLTGGADTPASSHVAVSPVSVSTVLSAIRKGTGWDTNLGNPATAAARSSKTASGLYGEAAQVLSF